MSGHDGGPAFPAMEEWEQMDDSVGGYRTMHAPHGGMSLRDYFAGQALALVLSQDSSRIADKLAVNAYEIADALLKERAK